MDHRQFQEILWTLSSAYGQLLAENIALRQERHTHQEPGAATGAEDHERKGEDAALHQEPRTHQEPGAAMGAEDHEGKGEEGLRYLELQEEEIEQGGGRGGKADTAGTCRQFSRDCDHAQLSELFDSMPSMIPRPALYGKSDPLEGPPLISLTACRRRLLQHPGPALDVSPDPMDGCPSVEPRPALHVSSDLLDGCPLLEPRPALPVSCEPLDGRPFLEPAEFDDVLHQLDNMSPPSNATNQDECQSAASYGHDVKALKYSELEVHEQYQRFIIDKCVKDTATVSDIIELALEYYPLLEVQHAVDALRRFMMHLCDINGDLARSTTWEEAAHDASLCMEEEAANCASGCMSETTSIMATESPMNLAIPFKTFLSLAQLDMSRIHESQALRGDAPILRKLHRAIVKEQKNHLDKKKQLFHSAVETVLVVVICINAITLGLSADDHSDFWFSIEIAFTTFYIFEIMMKMTTRGFRWFFLGAQRRWNLYDLAVVSIGCADLVVAKLVRKPSIGIQATDIVTLDAVALLGRLARLVRLLRFQVFNELKTMVHGTLVGLRVILWAMVLLAFFIYSMGLVMRSTVGSRAGEGNKYFDSFRNLQWSMFTLFLCFTDRCSAEDGTPLHMHLAEELGVGFMVLYVVMFLVGTFCVLNLTTALFIDYVMVASRWRAQEARGQNTLEMQNKLKDAICALLLKTQSELGLQRKAHEKAFSTVRSWYHRATVVTGSINMQQRKRAKILDEQLGMLDTGLKITREIFHMWLRDEQFLNLLNLLEIKTSNKSELFDVLDSDQCGELEVEEIISGLMHMRGPPEKVDVVGAVLSVRHIVAVVADMRAKLDTLLSLRDVVTCLRDVVTDVDKMRIKMDMLASEQTGGPPDSCEDGCKIKV